MNKETILKEIRRLAAAHGGVPPGRLVSESEAGIREASWRGVYWTKWSEAIKEPGFEPNKMTVAHPKEDLLEILAQMTKKLGRFPTSTELRLKGRMEESMPSDRTFSIRLGSKAAMIAQLLEFCRGRQGFDDVLAICQSALAQTPDDAEHGPVSPDGDGEVYLLKSGRRYKFGFTNDLDRRIRELAHQTAEEIAKVHSIRTDDPSGIEAYWKRRFAAKCVHNEWFTLDAKDVAAFRRRKKFM
jgi:hypothetical protein